MHSSVSSAVVISLVLSSAVNAMYRLETYYSETDCGGDVVYAYTEYEDPCTCPWTCQETAEIPGYWEDCVCVDDIDFDEIFPTQQWVALELFGSTPCTGDYKQAIGLPNDVCTEITDGTSRNYVCSGTEVELSECTSTACDEDCTNTTMPVDSCVEVSAGVHELALCSTSSAAYALPTVLLMFLGASLWV
ncbi:hypothetical protein Pelo_11954 [Pelomyxa schiedti]|nr:hypothetical protein Pelo_11954 [Pelomyxa schiedti]